MPKGNYVMVYGASTDNNAHIMKKEELAVLQPAIDRGDIKIVAEQFIPDWKKELALNFAENALTQNNDNIQAFVVSNDGMAGGVISAFSAKFNASSFFQSGMNCSATILISPRSMAGCKTASSSFFIMCALLSVDAPYTIT